MTDEASPPTATAYAVSLKLTDFWPSDPELWFAQAEALFTAQNVTQEKTKFGHVVRVLPARYASEVRDIILRQPEQPYKVLKAELTKRVCPSKRQRLQQLLHVDDLGDRKPSQLLRHMLKLRGDDVPDDDRDDIFRKLFLQKLPITIRTALATHKDATLVQLAEMADDMAEVQGPQPPVYQVQKESGPEITAIQSELLKISKMLQSQSRSTYEQRPSPPRLAFVGTTSASVLMQRSAANLVSFARNRETRPPVGERSPYDWQLSTPPRF